MIRILDDHGAAGELPNAAGWAWNRLTAFVEFVVGELGELSALEAALLALGALLIVRGLNDLTRLMSTEPGPVEIAELTEGGGDAETTRLAQLVRARLWDIGVLPTSVPTAPSSEAGPVAVVSAAPLPQATWIAQLLQHAPGILRGKHGHRVTGTAWRNSNTVDLSIAVSDVRRGRVERIVSVAGTDYDDVARRAAAAIYDEVTSHRRVQRKIKLWERWRDGGTGLALLQKAIDLERTDPPAAAAAYDDAVEADPFNGVARFSRAAATEASVAACNGKSPTAFEQLLDVAEDYREISELWPRYWQPRYRRAVLCSSVARWQNAWKAITTDPQKDEARKRFRRAVSPAFPDGDAPPLPDALLGEAIATWTSLVPSNGASAMVPRAMRRVLEVGMLCTHLQQQIASDEAGQARETVERVDRLARQSGQAHWELAYNFACFYALGIAPPFTPEERRVHAFSAIRQLDTAALTPSAELTRDWLRSDPDLENLGQWLVRANLRGSDVPQTAWFWRGIFGALRL